MNLKNYYALMTKLFTLSNTFLKSIDHNLKSIYIQYLRDNTRYNELVQRLKHLRSQIDEGRITARIDYLISRINRNPRVKKNIVEVYKDNKLVGILCDNIEKPHISIMRDETHVECDHNLKDVVQNYPRNDSNMLDMTMCTNLDDIDLEDGILFISLYMHDYRSFAGFTCVMLISTLHKTYVIDTLSIRDVRHKLWHCGTRKIFHCSKCVESFQREFGSLGCFTSLNHSTDVYVDWRIRPINNVMMDILKHDVLKMISNSQNISQPESKNIINASSYDYTLFTNEDIEISELTNVFMVYYNISKTDYDVVYNILKLRNFVASSNNESPWYVMTDKQVVRLIVEKPETSESFMRVIKRASALAREHIFDIVLIIRNFRRDEESTGLDARLFEDEIEEQESDNVSTFSISDEQKQDK